MHIQDSNRNNQNFNHNYAGSAPPNHYNYSGYQGNQGNQGQNFIPKPMHQFNPYGSSPVSTKDL